MKTHDIFVRRFTYKGVLNILKSSMSLFDFQQELRRCSAITWKKDDIYYVLDRMCFNPKIKDETRIELERLKHSEKPSEDGYVPTIGHSSIQERIRLCIRDGKNISAEDISN